MRNTLYGLLALALLALLPTLTLGQDEGFTDLQVIPIPAQPAEPDKPDATEKTADEPTTQATDAAGPDDTATPKPDAAEKLEPGTLRFHLMDGSIITGKLKTDKLPIKTEFGELVVPITAIQSFAPGLASHPKLDQQIQQLIQQLGSPDAKKRDQAQGMLISYGGGLVPELQRYTDDPDAERKARVETIIDALLAQEEDDFLLDDSPVVSLNRLDQIVTEKFTVAGEIKQVAFKIESKFGVLEVNLADIKAAERISTEKPEVRRSVDVQGSDMVGRNWKNTRVRVNRGDRIVISADGQITMTPWGNNTVSGPDGIPQNGMYKGNIPMGGLAGRIGDSGEEFMVGSKKAFVAQKSGTLYLGFAIQQNWQNYQFPGKYVAKIRLVPAE